MTSAPPGAMTLAPNTERVRASRSGHGATTPVGLTGASRATGRRRRVTSMVSPRSTRAMTRLRFCWSSRTDTVDSPMFDILSYITRPGTNEDCRAHPVPPGYVSSGRHLASRHASTACAASLSAALLRIPRRGPSGRKTAASRQPARGSTFRTDRSPAWDSRPLRWRNPCVHVRRELKGEGFAVFAADPLVAEEDISIRGPESGSASHDSQMIAGLSGYGTRGTQMTEK